MLHKCDIFISYPKEEREKARIIASRLNLALHKLSFSEVLNYVINRSTNAHAESLNSKLKGFRAQLRGVQDLPFFMFRASMIFG